MKISLAGPSYTSDSVNAAAQRTMNLVPEVIEPGNEPVKMVLYGRPGIKLLTTLSNPTIRALWAGGGRLFAINGPKQTEIHSDGTFTDQPGTLAVGTAPPDWAQVFSNGHQLMIISGGYVHYNNGAGVVAAHFQMSGTGTTVAANNTLVYVSGPAFQASWAGLPILIDDVDYVIASVDLVNNWLYLNTAQPTVNASNVDWSLAGGAAVDARTGGFIDGYFVISRTPRPDLPQTQDPGRQFNISGLLDGTYWDPAMYGVKEGRGDYINSVLCDHEQLILFGAESTEIWQNVGATADNLFPFQRIPGAYIQDGTVAIYAPCSVGPTFCWLGGGPDGQTRAYRADGLQPTRISTHAQEWDWNAPGFRVNDASSYSYQNAGHLHWVVNFWQQQQTWVYDTNTGMWHERAFWDPVGLDFLRYKGWFHVFIPEWGDGGMHIVASPESGKIYTMSSNLYDDDGTAIEYVRAFPHLINENEYAYHHRLEVMAEMGALGSTDPVPVLGLDWSDDHGHTFLSALGRQVNMPGAGNYTWRAVFRRLGKARDRVYRVGITAHTKVALIDTYLEMTQGFA
jgi:hypothetical protein